MTDVRRVSLGTWEIVGNSLQPTLGHYMELAKSSKSASEIDPKVTFLLPDQGSSSSSTMTTVHRSRLIAAGGPLSSLVTAPFAESTSLRVRFNETRASFDMIHDFLYNVPIDMRQVTCDLAFAADRWGLTLLLDACWRWAELGFFDDDDRNDDSVPNGCGRSSDKFAQFVSFYFPLLATIEAPQRFKEYFSLRFALGFTALEEKEIEDLRFPSLGHMNKATEAPTKRRRTETNADAQEVMALDDEQGEDIISPASVRGTASGTTCSAERSKGFSSQPKANVAKRKLQAEDNSKGWKWDHEQVWSAFADAGVLHDIVRYLAHFGTSSCYAKLINIILHTLQPRLSDTEMNSLLEQFNWEDEAGKQAVRSEFSANWSLRSWRLLTLTTMNSRGQGRNGVRLTMTFRFSRPFKRPSFGLRFEAPWYEEAICGAFKVWGMLRVSDYTNHRLLLYIIIWRYNRYLKVNTQREAQISLIQDGCSCGLDTGKDSIGIFDAWVKPSSSVLCTIPYRAHCNGYPLMSSDAMREWKRTHKAQCHIAIRMTLNIGTDYVEEEIDR